jgi:hypothetical protein
MREGGAWYTSVAPGARRLFRGRHYHRVSVGDGRVIVATRRGRIVLDTPVEALRLAEVNHGILLQVLARDESSRTHVFEFRPRRHAAGREFADALR